MSLILLAARYATFCHSKQVRKWTGEPYIRHPGRVASRLMELFGVTEDEVAAAWCHDIIEDCGQNSGTVQSMTNSRVAELVLQLTNTSKLIAPNASRFERKRIDRERLSAISDSAKRIKLLDRIDNVTDMVNAPDDFRQLYFEETRLLLNAIKSPWTELEYELRSLVRR